MHVASPVDMTVQELRKRGQSVAALEQAQKRMIEKQNKTASVLEELMMEESLKKNFTIKGSGYKVGSYHYNRGIVTSSHCVPIFEDGDAF